MVYTITSYGCPLLREVSKDIDNNYPDLTEFIANMYETMTATDGIGLAAPQVHRSIRLFVVDGTPLEEDDSTLKDFKKVFINPKIISYEGEDSNYEEGCLSLPDIRENVVRKSKIRITYYDQQFNPHDEIFEGIKARIIQHEYDHLEGILFVDLISPLRKRLINGKLNAIAHGKVKPRYRMRFPKQ